MNKLDYTDIFDFRGASYNRACTDYPMARQEERASLLALIDLPPQAKFCDAPAGGGYLADGLYTSRPDLQITCVEPSSNFGKVIDDNFRAVHSPIDSIPIADGYFDGFGSLAGLHHIEDRRPLFHEWARLLAPGGMLAVADVEVGSSTGGFLNGFVDQYTPQGHEGMFFAAGEFTTLMEAEGFHNIREEYLPIHWVFDNREGAAIFCKDLFYLQGTSIDEIASALESELGSAETRDGLHWQVPWGLRYAVGTKK